MNPILLGTVDSCAKIAERLQINDAIAITNSKAIPVGLYVGCKIYLCDGFNHPDLWLDFIDYTAYHMPGSKFYCGVTGREYPNFLFEPWLQRVLKILIKERELLLACKLIMKLCELHKADLTIATIKFFVLRLKKQ